MVPLGDPRTPYQLFSDSVEVLNELHARYGEVACVTGRHSTIFVHNALVGDTPVTLLYVEGDHFDNLTMNVLYVIGGEVLSGNAVVLNPGGEDSVSINDQRN